MKKYWIVGISLLFSSVTLLYAQTPAYTPTAAPTKTPPATATSATSTSETETPEADNNPFAQRAINIPYSQEDLTVLVGNVQRPNGIIWLNNNLYTACNGDYTLYEVNAVTGQTITLVFGVQNAYTLYGETTPQGYNLWIPDFQTNQFVLVDQRRTAPRVIVRQGLDAPWGVAAFDEGSFLITNVRSNTIVHVTRNGTLQQVADGLRAPTGIVVDDDRVYVANNGSARRAIEWFERSSLAPDAEKAPVAKPLVSGLQNAHNLVMGADGYLYFTYALGTRGVVGRVLPENCLEGCTNEAVEIVVYTDIEAPLAGLAFSPEMRLYVHSIFKPEIYWVDLYK